MVHHHDDGPLARRESRQRHPEQRAALQIERPSRFEPRQALDFRRRFLFGQAAEIDNRDRQFEIIVDHLHRASLHLGERGAQDLVSVHHPLQAPDKDVRVEVAAETQSLGDVVDGAFRLKLVQEPETLLGEGKRQAVVRSLHPDQRRRLDALFLAHQLFQNPRQSLDRRLLEEQADRHLHPERLAQPADHLRGQERVAADLEEVVLRANAAGPEQLCPETGDQLFHRRARRHVGSLNAIRTVVRRRQGPTVHLAAGRQRQRIQHHKRGRDHVVRQPLGQVVAQLAAIHVGFGRGRHHVRNQPFVAGPVLPHDHSALAHQFVLTQQALDLAQLDSVTADLHLVVHPPQELDSPVGQKPTQVPGSVKALARPACKRIRHELLSRQIRAVPVAPRQADSSHADLARNTRRHGAKVLVQNVDLHVGDRPADRRRGGPVRQGLHQSESGANRGFRRTVGVEQPSARRPLLHDVRRAGFASRDQRLQVIQAFHRHESRHGRRQRHHGDFLVSQQSVELLHVHQLLLGCQDQGGATQQRHESLGNRGVEAERGELQNPTFRGHAEGSRLRLDEIHQAPVSQHHTLGATGGAGRVNHVGQVVGAGAARHALFGTFGDFGPLGVQLDHGLQLFAEALHQVLQGTLRQDNANAAVLNHVGKTVTRVRRIQGNVSATGFHHAQHADDHLRGALHTDSDRRFRANAQLSQMPGKLVRAAVEVRVGHLRTFVLHRHPVRVLPGHFLKPLVRTARVLEGLRCVVPLHQQPVALPVLQEIDGTETCLRPARHDLEKPAVVANQTLHRLPVEKVRVVLQHAFQAAGPLLHRKREIVLRQARVRVQAFHTDATQSATHVRHVLEHEHHLEKGRVAEVAVRLHSLHHLLERNVLVRVGAKRNVPDTPQQLTERRVATQIRAEDQSVDEEADQVLDFEPVAVGGHAAHADVFLAAESAEQPLPRPEEGHEKRDPLALAQFANALAQSLTQLEGDLVPVEGFDGRSRPVRGQFKRLAGARELLLPVVQLSLQDLVPKPAALPGGEVRVLNRQFLSGGFFVPQKRFVGLTHFADHGAHGPAVRDDVVHDDNQHPALVRHGHQRYPEQRTALQVETAPRFDAHNAPCLSLGSFRIEIAQVDYPDRQFDGLVDHLHWNAAIFRERGAQDFVPLHHPGQTADENVGAKIALEAESLGNVVDGATRFELIQEPEAFLRVGKRHPGGETLGFAKRRYLQAATFPDKTLHLLRHPRHGRAFEEHPDRQLHTERVADPAHDLGGQQRVAADLEKVVQHAHPVDTQRLLPDAHEQLLHGRSGGHVGAFTFFGCVIRRRKCAAVHLAVRRQRQGVEADESRWNHVLRKLVVQELAKLSSAYFLPFLRHHVRHEPAVAGAILPRQDHGLVQLRMLAQHRLDLAQLDPVAAHLDLVVETPQEFHLPVVPVAHQVAAAVEPRALLTAERVGYKTLRRQLRPIQVASCNAGAADVELARNSVRSQLHVLVEDVDPGVRNCATDGHRSAPAPVLRHPVHHAPDHRFRRSVLVVQLRLWSHLLPVADLLGGQVLAADDERVRGTSRPFFRELLAQKIQVGRGNLDQTEVTLLAKNLRQGLDVVADRRQHNTLAADQRTENGGHGRVESDRRVDNAASAAVQRVRSPHPLQVVPQPPVRNQGPFGLPRGSGCVNHVGQAFGKDLHLPRPLGQQFDLVPVQVDQHHLSADQGKRVGHPGLGQNHARVRVLQHVANPFGRVAWIHRQVGRACLQNRQQGHDQIG